MAAEAPESLVIAGANDVRIWGLTSRERITRLAAQAGIGGPESRHAVLWIDQGYAFDPLWLSHVISKSSVWVVDGDRPVMVHDAPTRLPAGGGNSHSLPAEAVVYQLQDRPVLYNEALRKQQQPFFEPLVAGSVQRLERESYYGAYKGITDILTKFLWPELAFHLTRLAAWLRMTPNMVTTIGAILCVLATWLFWRGDYWPGIVAGFVFMVLDTVDGKLARCTITSSGWGEFFDHGIDLVHPPFWWFAWGVGLGTWSLGFSDKIFWTVQTILFGGYIAQRLIEGWFIKRFGIHIHVWRKFDSDFRLITARRNPNMILLVGAMLFSRPDIGLLLVTGWTVVSLVVHLVQVVQAERARARGIPVMSWLEQQA